MWVIFALLDPDPDPFSNYGSGSGSNGPIEYGSNTDPDTDPDPKPCFYGSFLPFWIRIRNTDCDNIRLNTYGRSRALRRSDRAHLRRIACGRDTASLGPHVLLNSLCLLDLACNTIFLISINRKVISFNGPRVVRYTQRTKSFLSLNKVPETLSAISGLMRQLSSTHLGLYLTTTPLNNKQAILLPETQRPGTQHACLSRLLGVGDK